MSPTFLEITVGLIAATFVFLFAVRAIPIVIDWLARYMNRSFNASLDENEERKRHQDER